MNSTATEPPEVGGSGRHAADKLLTQEARLLSLGGDEVREHYYQPEEHLRESA